MHLLCPQALTLLPSDGQNIHTLLSLLHVQICVLKLSFIFISNNVVSKLY